MNGIGRNLKKIRLLKGLSLKEAGALLNMSATAVTKYENGELVPDSTKLIEFADAYNVTALDLLKSYAHPEMKLTTFRKKKRLTGQNLELLKDLIRDEVAKYFEVLDLSNIDENNNKLPIYNCNTLEDAEQASLKFRREIMKINDILPIYDLTNTLESLGVIVIYIKNTLNKFDGFDGVSESVGNIPFIILLDETKDGARQRFTIAHELGHLILNIKDSYSVDKEKLCNRFASSLLMPKEAILNEFKSLNNKVTFRQLDLLKKKYKVSYSAALYRLKDLNLVSDYYYRSLSIYLSSTIGKEDPSPITPEKTYLFNQIVYNLESCGIITIQKACELLGVTLDEYNK